MVIDHFKVQHFAARTHEKMQEVLMHPKSPGPKSHYYMIRGGKEIKNITVWEFGTIGGEYIKTYGHYHVGNLKETYSILSGEGLNMSSYGQTASMLDTSGVLLSVNKKPAVFRAISS